MNQPALPEESGGDEKPYKPGAFFVQNSYVFLYVHSEFVGHLMDNTH